MKNLIPILVIALMTSVANAGERALADSLAAAGATFATKGNTEKAKEMFYKALANDESCPDAIFELAKIFDKENNLAAASDFYQRASLLMGQENKPNTAAKRTEADRRVRTLNPFAPRMITLYEEYAQDLDRLVKRVPDSVTQDSALARVNELKLPNVITPEKLPKFYASANAEKVAEADTAKKPVGRSRIGIDGETFTPAKGATKVAPDVERELKAAGWATVTGTWVKKGPNLYEVTDGKLEAPKVNGGVDVWVHKSSTGTVKIAVRNDFNANENYFGEYTGYGFAVGKRECRLYVPYIAAGYGFFGGGTARYDPTNLKSEALPEANAKNRVMMSVQEGTLEYLLNEKKIFRYNEAKLPRTGPFVIQVNGTALIETPRCAGQ